MRLKLKSKMHVIDNVWTFVWEPEEPLDYTAGQYGHIEVPHNYPDDKGTRRYFTNSAAPYEGVFQITTRLTGSTFKNALSRMEPGDDSAKLLGKIEGDFVWKQTQSPTLYIAAGIGVTPFHSILKQRTYEGKEIPVTLLYNGRTDDLPWKPMFAELEEEHPEFKVIYVIGERLTPESIEHVYPELNNSLVYLSGPEPMVEAVGDALKENGLPEDKLVQDWFPGYEDDNY